MRGKFYVKHIKYHASIWRQYAEAVEIITPAKLKKQDQSEAVTAGRVHLQVARTKASVTRRSQPLIPWGGWTLQNLMPHISRPSQWKTQAWKETTRMRKPIRSGRKRSISRDNTYEVHRVNPKKRAAVEMTVPSGDTVAKYPVPNQRLTSFCDELKNTDSSI